VQPTAHRRRTPRELAEDSRGTAPALAATMQTRIVLASLVFLTGCFDMDLDSCPADDDDAVTDVSATLTTSSALADASVGRPISVYAQYLVDPGELCTADLDGTCSCTDGGLAPAEFEVVEVGCDDDACDVESVGDYVGYSREIVIVPKLDAVTVRVRVASSSDAAPDATVAYRVIVPSGE
jgi:hypothetical protein